MTTRKAPKIRRFVAVSLAVLALSAVLPARAQVPDQASQAPRPNILVIVTDDQAWSVFNRQTMPNVYDRIVDRGILFERAYVNTSQCCPSRAAILTGTYAHHNGVDGNSVKLLHPTFAEMLHDEGYRTMLAGKYLNSWPCKPRAEFEVLACVRGANEHAPLVDPVVYRDGERKRKKGYQTEILARILSKEIQATPFDQPFAAIYSPTSPHMPANDNRYRSMPVAPYRPGNFDKAPAGGTAPSYATRRPLRQAEIDKIDMTYRKMTRATRGLDDSIGRLLDSLESRLDNTIIFFISDNGYLYGEHRLRHKVAPYEESTRVPFAVSYPAMMGGSAGNGSQALVQNVDIAPTIAELVGRAWGADGVSLTPLFRSPQAAVRDAALIENCQGIKYPCHGIASRGSRIIPSFWGVVTDRYKYVEYLTGHKELFDLQSDPYELVNLTGDESHSTVKQALAQRLLLLRRPPAPETTMVAGPRGESPEGDVAFRYFSQHRDTAFVCRLNVGDTAGAWRSCNRFEQAFTGLLPGTYEFEVAAQFNGLSDPTPAVRSFEVVAGG